MKAHQGGNAEKGGGPAAIDSGERVALVVTAEQAGMRLDALLSTSIEVLSRARAAKHITDGRVSVAGVATRQLKPAYRVEANAAVVVVAPQPPSDLVPWHDASLVIVYEDEDLIVINKPAGLVVHPGAGHPDETLVNALLAHVPELDEVGATDRPGLVHRIDKDTSGLLVVSKTPTAHTRLSADFAQHDIERRYVALVLGRVANDGFTVESGHTRHGGDRRRFTGRKGGSRRAVTHVTVLSRSVLTTLVVATLETGRTHQIRMHLSERGHPIAGDALYGGIRNHPRTPTTIPEIAVLQQIGRQCLHAYTLGFRHPMSGQRLRFHCPMPQDMHDAVVALHGSEGADLPQLDVALFGPG